MLWSIKSPEPPLALAVPLARSASLGPACLGAVVCPDKSPCMNTNHEPKPRIRFLTVVCCCFALLAFSGCASYFRTGDMSYEELRQQNQFAAKTNNLMFKPGAVLYSR